MSMTIPQINPAASNNCDTVPKKEHEELKENYQTVLKIVKEFKIIILENQKKNNELKKEVEYLKRKQDCWVVKFHMCMEKNIWFPLGVACGCRKPKKNINNEFVSGNELRETIRKATDLFTDQVPFVPGIKTVKSIIS